MLYICILSNKFDFIQAISVFRRMFDYQDKIAVILVKFVCQSLGGPLGVLMGCSSSI